MELILALGSNIGDRTQNLCTAKTFLQKHFTLVKESKVVQSEPVDYLDQPKFLNQVIQWETQIEDPKEILSITQSIEKQMGRQKLIPKGPRNIDIDIIFLGKQKVSSPELTIPHPEWNKREFVRTPLQELPYAQKSSFLA